MEKRKVAIVVAVIVVVALLVIVGHNAHMKKPRGDPNSLYNRLGGIYAISAVVNDFSDALIKNPIVGQDSPNQFLQKWSRDSLDRLPGLKWMRSLWVAALAGGPYKFIATKPGKCPFSLENAHKQFQISPEEFDEVARELANSLSKFNVGAREKGEVLAVFAAHKAEVTRGYNQAHHLSSPAIKCPFLSRQLST